MAILEGAGVRDVEGTELAVTVTHPTFEKWWEPCLHGVGPVGESVAALGRGPPGAAEGHLPGAAQARTLRPDRGRLRRPRPRLSVVRRLLRVVRRALGVVRTVRPSHHAGTGRRSRGDRATLGAS